jgi:hypothetical protein
MNPMKTAFSKRATAIIVAAFIALMCGAVITFASIDKKPEAPSEVTVYANETLTYTFDTIKSWFDAQPESVTSTIDETIIHYEVSVNSDPAGAWSYGAQSGSSTGDFSFTPSKSDIGKSFAFQFTVKGSDSSDSGQGSIGTNYVTVTVLGRQEATPNAGYDLDRGVLTGLLENVVYLINDKDTITNDFTIKPEWYGTTISIVAKSDSAFDSESQMLAIPQRPVSETTTTAAPSGIDNIAPPVYLPGSSEIILKTITKNLFFLPDGIIAGNVRLPIETNINEFAFGINYDTDRTRVVTDCIEKKYQTEILAAFETDQKGGWGSDVTMSFDLEALNIVSEQPEIVYVVIYDPETENWYQVPAVIKDNEITFTTKRTGIIVIVTESVR